MRNKNDWEKQAQKQMQEERKRAERERKAREKEQNSSNREGSLEGMSVKERMEHIRNSQSKKKKTNIPDKTVDLTEEKNKYLLETPLPSTMATDFFPIEKIDDGIIYTEDNRCLKIIEVMPINFLLRNENEQADVIYSFERYLRMSPDHFQIISLSKKTDISKYIEKINEEIEKETNEGCKRLQYDYRELIENVGANEAVSRRFFVVFEYKPGISARTTKRDISYQFSIMQSRLTKGLKACGNTVLVMENPIDETARILYDILNREKNSSTDFLFRIYDVEDYYREEYGEESLSSIPITEYFTPRTIDFTSSTYTKINNTYYDFLYVKSDGYPLVVPGGWTSLFVNAGEGIDMTMTIEKYPRNKVLDKVGRKIRWDTSRIGGKTTSSNEFDDLESTISSGYYLKNGLSKGNQDFYYMTILLTISAKTLDELVWKRQELTAFLKTHEIDVRECAFDQREALLSSLPLCYTSPSIFNRAKRNIMTSDLAGLYPFTSYEMSDEDGVLLGVNELNDSLCIADFFNSDVYKNANIAIMGTSGAGKTYLLQLLAMRFRRKRIQTFIIAPDKGHEFARACENIGGQFIMLSPSSNQCINVMEIRKKDETVSELLEGGLRHQSKLAEKIQSLHIFFELLIPDMNDEEKQLLDEALVITYNKKGITHDNESLIDPNDPEKYREMPILGDVYDVLIDRPESRRIANIMNRLVHGSASSFNQQTNVNLDNLYTVIDISTLTGNLLPVGMYVALDYVYSKAKEDRTKKKAIIIDEVWELIGAKSNRKAAEFVLEIFKIIRGYGGSAICATQDLHDFFALDDGMYGNGIINNSKTKIVLNLENREAESVRELLALSDAEFNQIIHFERGHGLLSTAGNNVPISFKASKMENDLITTDRKQLASLAEQHYGTLLDDGSELETYAV